MLVLFWVAVAQKLEQAIYWLEVLWFGPLQFQSARPSIFGQDTEPQVAPDVFIGVLMCVNVR